MSNASINYKINKDLNRITFCLTIMIFFFILNIAKGQQNSALELGKPVTPAAFQFLKYIEMPIGQHTGIPNITVPLYEINEDGVSIPLKLSYHSAGHRVNEEASYIGLGWNLQFGSIVQIVNDLDDLDPSFIRVLPDYIGSTVPSELPYRWEWPWEIYGSGPSIPIITPQPNYAFPIATGGYYPVNGNYSYVQPFLTAANYDSEPDIFKASFLGYNINFVLDWKNGFNITVLNEVGFKVVYLNGGVFEITVPNGEKYQFSLKSSATSTSYSTITTSTNNYGGGGSVSQGAASSIWMLTNVTTRNKKNIIINYLKTTAFTGFPNFSQSWKHANFTNDHSYGNGLFTAFSGNLPEITAFGEITSNTSIQSDSHIIPTSIVFSSGRVDFYNSPRLDVLGGKKIDSIHVSAQELVKSFKMTYNYSNSAYVGGGGFLFDSPTYGNTPYLRLKLATVTNGSDGTYQFNYDNTNLPGKNSYAQDQWGLYNGALFNTSLIPNPIQYQRNDLGNNNNNHSANYNYAKAEILKQIVYPTGGSVNFEYELNTFDNYWVPDYASTTNTISTGNGLRVKSVTWKEIDGSFIKKQAYTYSGGKAIQPISMYRNYTSNHTTVIDDLYQRAETKQYFIEEYNANGYYGQSSLSSISGVGYNAVVTTALDNANNNNGSIVTTYYNYPSIIPNNSVQFMSKVPISVPSIEDREQPKLGLEKTVEIYDKQQVLKKKTTNTYNNYNPSFHYAARVNGYQRLFYYIPPSGTGSGIWTSQPQQLVAIYPIYDFKTKLVSSEEIEYIGTETQTKNSWFTYNSYNLLTKRRDIYDGIEEVISTTYVMDNPNSPTLSAMVAQNRFNDILSVKKEKRYQNLPSNVMDGESTNTFGYQQFNNTFQINSVTINNNPNSRTVPKIKTYDLYDAFGNLLQYTENGMTTSMIYSYNNKYVVAIVQNSNFNALSDILGASQLNSFSTSLPTDGQARNFLSLLRTDNRLKNSLITTYTYKPLIGISSVTDPKGLVTTFEYNGFGQLNNVRDQNGNIIKNYNYHFKQ